MPGSPAGLAARRQFIHDVLAILGDAAILYVPLGTDTTTSTTADRNGRTITWDATVAARYSTQGSGLLLDFDGTDDEGDTPDVAALTFGDGTNDLPFSIGGLYVPDANNALMTLMGKANSSSAEEYEFYLDASGHLNFRLTDESASAFLEGRYAAAVGTSLTLLSGTYDGSRAITGVRLFTDGVSRTVTNDSSGSYVAMENTAALLHFGARYTTKEQFYNGREGFQYITPGVLQDEQQWALKELVNGHYGLTL